MHTNDLQKSLHKSLVRQEAILQGSLILNPVENIPFSDDLAPTAGLLHGLYNTDKLRNNREKRETSHQFAGRDRIAYDSRRIYSAWADMLGAADASLRLLSGLQAHAAIFMAATNPGDKLLLLPEMAGGHMATKSILERLGLDIIEMEIDAEHHCIDVEATVQKISNRSVNYIFIDRSEGLVYEDFSPLIERVGAPTIFDCSQYLTQIIAGDYVNPFEMGSSTLISTLHKNFPGPQKALAATHQIDELWTRIRSGLSTYVSNMHLTSTYAAGLTLARRDWIIDYSSRMIENTKSLDQALSEENVPVIKRADSAPTTHHIWIGPLERRVAFDWFKRLEHARINVNYRLLPYGIGYGLRLGLAAMTRQGLRPEECKIVAQLISSALGDDRTSIKHQVRSLAEDLWTRML